MRICVCVRGSGEPSSQPRLLLLTLVFTSCPPLHTLVLTSCSPPSTLCSTDLSFPSQGSPHSNYLLIALPIRVWEGRLPSHTRRGEVGTGGWYGRRNRRNRREEVGTGGWYGRRNRRNRREEVGTGGWYGRRNQDLVRVRVVREGGLTITSGIP
jgi:hypothetical protein